MARSYRGAGTVRWAASDGHSPRVGENGNWWQWDDAIGDYVDTGIKAKGTDGVQGPTPYPVGSWDANITYTRNKKTAPYVEFMGEYYLLDKEGSFKGVVPTNTGVWTKFESFSQVYTEILLADFARLAAAVFVDNKLISKYGIDDEGNFSENYWEYPNNFTPNWETDLLTGLQKFGKNIVFGRRDGVSVLEYYDNSGQLLYDLGPTGITEVNIRPEEWIETKLIYIASNYEQALSFNNSAKWKDSINQTETTYWRYQAKMVAGVNQDPTNDGKLFVSKGNKDSGHPPQGIYCRKTIGMEREQQTDGTGVRIYPPGIHPNNEAVYDRYPLYSKRLSEFKGGLEDNMLYAYWNPAFSPI